MLTPYDEIELHGLTENGTDDLPIPNDDELQGRAVGDENGGEKVGHGSGGMIPRRAT